MKHVFTVGKAVGKVFKAMGDAIQPGEQKK